MCAQIASITPERVFGRRVREARERRGLSQAELADRLRELGHAADRTIVSKIEKGQRTRASIGEVLVYAAALEMAPIHLIVPREDEEVIGVSSALVLPAPLARAWIRGEVRRPGGDVISHIAEIPPSEFRALVRGGQHDMTDAEADALADEIHAALGEHLARRELRKGEGDNDD